MNPPRLDSLIARARHLDVKPEHARAYVADLDRWARREGAAPRRRRWPAFAVGFGVAAVFAALALWLLGPDTSARRRDELATNTAPLTRAPEADAVPLDPDAPDASVAPTSVATPADASPAPPRLVHAPPRNAEIAPQPTLPPDAGPALPTINDRWRSARLLRSQAKFAEAVTECEAIAATQDRTWAPIALVEAARIELGPLAAPERALTYLERFEREWSGDGLLPEARDLRCHALEQLGRGSECKSGH